MISLVVIFSCLLLVRIKGIPNSDTNSRRRTSDSSAPTPWNFNSGSEQVWYGDYLWYENYVGKSSYEYDVGFEYDTKFRICSNSKLITAVAFMQLVEKGLVLSIFDDINKYLNETDLISWGFPAGTTKWCPAIFPNNETICERNITMSFASILSMQSGVLAAIVCPYSPNQWQYQYCLPTEANLLYYGSIADTIAMFAHNPLWVAPNTSFFVTESNMKSGDLYGSGNNNAFFYANENFVLISYMIQKLSGMSFSRYVKKYIFDVIGMPNTYFDQWSQAFNIQSSLSSEYYFYTELPFPPSIYPDTLSGAYPPFALGSCTSTEVNPGYQSGSGGIVSTLPDMVKWYSSLFITKNTTVLSNQSLYSITYPWAIENAFPQYYGFGVDLMYESVILQSPDINTAPMPISVSYMGGSMCTFFSIVLWNSSYNVFGGDMLITYPLISVVARNNRILNITQDIWNYTQNSIDGTWNTLTSASNNNGGWSDTTCCGSVGGALTDTYTVAFNLLYYYGVLIPSSLSGSDSTNNSSNKLSQSAWIAIIISIVVLIGIMFIIWRMKENSKKKEMLLTSIHNECK